jgi:hypothetical protein
MEKSDVLISSLCATEGLQEVISILNEIQLVCLCGAERVISGTSLM